MRAASSSEPACSIARLPLVRYRTEDRATWRHHRCACGRSFDRFDQVEGRWLQEYVIGRNGAKISPSALNLHGTMLDNVLRYQYYQNQPGIMEVRLVVSTGFSTEDADALSRAFSDRVGAELEVRLKVVSDIPLTNRGKLPRLIQEIAAAPPSGRA